MFSRQPHPIVTVLTGFVLISLVGLVDWFSGYESSFSLFYVIPVALIAWQLGRWPGVFASLVSALVWLWADSASGHAYSHPLIPFWNTLVRLSFYLIITVLLTLLRESLRREQALARTDGLTGAVNSRQFLELARTELDRLQRYGQPITIAYLDVDNFKQVNDHFGHAVGDRLLRSVVERGKPALRRLDVFARLGGDEFAILFPKTDEQAAKIVAEKLRAIVLEGFRHDAMPVTLSMGVLTCTAAPAAVDELIALADGLMYRAKHGGKNAIQYAVYRGPEG